MLCTDMPLDEYDEYQLDGVINHPLGEMHVEIRQDRCRFQLQMFLNQELVGELGWIDGHNVNQEGMEIISRIETRPDMRCKGIATAMWDFANQNGFTLTHSYHRSPSGYAWSKKVGGKDYFGNNVEDCPNVEENDYEFVNWERQAISDAYRKSQARLEYAAA